MNVQGWAVPTLVIHLLFRKIREPFILYSPKGKSCDIGNKLFAKKDLGV